MTIVRRVAHIIGKRVEGHEMLALFLITFLVHAAVAVFLSLTEFFPFAGGRDDLTYHGHAIEYAEWFRSFNYTSLQGLYTSHWYPAFLGFLYALTGPVLVVGMLGSALLAGGTAVLLYKLARELGGPKKAAFWIALGMTNLYLSFLLYGTLTLKDTLVIPLALAMLVLTIKLVQRFGVKHTVLLMVVLLLLATLRFYVAFMLLAAFFLAWFVWSRSWQPDRTHAYGVLFILLFGFELQFLGLGFLGIERAAGLLNPGVIAERREVAYSFGRSETNIQVFWRRPAGPEEANGTFPDGEDAGFGIQRDRDKEGSGGKTTALVFSGVNYAKSFATAALGPFPWQLKSAVLVPVLAETFAWYVLLFFIIKGVLREYPWRKGLAVLFFGLALLAAIGLFSDNLGANTRLRMAAFFALSAFAPLAFKKPEKQHEKKTSG